MAWWLVSRLKNHRSQDQSHMQLPRLKEKLKINHCKLIWCNDKLSLERREGIGIGGEKN